jgi:hypothetical protein
LICIYIYIYIYIPDKKRSQKSPFLSEAECKSSEQVPVLALQLERLFELDNKVNGKCETGYNKHIYLKKVRMRKKNNGKGEGNYSVLVFFKK